MTNKYIVMWEDLRVELDGLNQSDARASFIRQYWDRFLKTSYDYKGSDVDMRNEIYVQELTNNN